MYSTYSHEVCNTLKYVVLKYERTLSFKSVLDTEKIEFVVFLSYKIMI